MVKMIIMDLDGTLLTNDKNISDYTVSILEKCKTIGIKIVIATARSERSAKRCIDLVGPDSMILNGGALVINNDKKMIYQKLLSIKTSDGIINECIKNKNIGDMTVETKENYYVSYKNSAYHSDYKHGKYNDFLKPLSQEIYKITVKINDRSMVKSIALDIENKFRESKFTSFSGENWHIIAHKEVEKMAAINELVKNEGINITEVIAFGDDYNDIEMIKRCGIGIAMENGIDEIKKVAKYVCGKNEEDGLGKWIEENVIKKRNCV